MALRPPSNVTALPSPSTTLPNLHLNPTTTPLQQQSNVSSVGSNQIRLPMPSLPDLSTFQLPTNHAIQQSISSLSHSNSTSNRNMANTNPLTVKNRKRPRSSLPPPTKPTNPNPDTMDTSTPRRRLPYRSESGSLSDDDYDYYEDYHDNHEYDQREDDEFETRFRSGRRRRRTSVHRNQPNSSNSRDRKSRNRVNRHSKKSKSTKTPKSRKKSKSTAKSMGKSTGKNRKKQKITTKDGEHSTFNLTVSGTSGGSAAGSGSNDTEPETGRSFQCKKCRRSFSTNRALASHQRAHKNKVPPPGTIKTETEETTATEEEREQFINRDRSVSNIPPRITSSSSSSNRSSSLLANLPNLNTVPDGMTRLAMPEIKSGNRYHLNNQDAAGGQQVVSGIPLDDYEFHCNKCQHPFFDRADVEKHHQFADCVNRPYLCPFCERPFKSVLSVKKHCVNLHSSFMNWDLVGGLLQFVEEQQKNARSEGELNYRKMVRRYARQFYLRQELQSKKPNDR